MKKAITTILSALLLISCLTVNVFAEGEEQNTQGSTIQETTVTDQVDTDNANQTNESAASQESNDGNASRQTATDASVTVGDITVSLIRNEDGLYNLNFEDYNAPNAYQAIAFENEHFIVNYNGSELHGNCNNDSHNQSKLEPAIINGLYQYVTTDDSGNSVFSIVIDYGVNASLNDVTASISINDIVYGFEKKEDCNLFVFTPGNNPVQPEDFNPKNSVINISVPNSDPLDCHLNGSGPYEGYSVEFYTIVWFETLNGFEHACFAMRYSENSGGGDNQGNMPQVFVDNKEFYLDDVVDSTKVYISNSRGAHLDFNVQEIVNAVNSESDKRGAIFVDYECNYVRDDNSGYPENISDGYEVEPSWYVGLKLYYLDNPELLNSSHLNSDSLSRVENFNNTINTKLEYSNFENYSGAYEHRLKTELKLPYSVNGGTLLFPTEETEEQGNLNQNSDAIVWITHEVIVREGKERIIFYRNMSFSKPASVIHYDIFSEQDENYDSSRVIFIGGKNNIDYPATSEGLVKAINELRHSGKSAVVLKEDITLNRDAYIKHVTVERSEDSYSALHDIEINLNGHNINANGYSLINLRTSTIHITNYVVDENGRSTDELNRTAKITGSNANPAIINYGGLYVLSNITVENKKGTGVVTYNSGDLFLTNGTKIDASICVDIRENEMFSDGRNSANIDIRGELNASYIAIQSTTVESDVVNNINLYSGSVDNSVQKVKITSSDIGIRTIGNVNINVYGCEVYADSPLIMSGGTIEVRHANFSSTNGKPVILVDSNNENATDTTILIAAEANVCMSTSGTLIEEISSTTKSKIKSIYFYSINSKDESYFDYANGKLFEFSAVPSSNSILINGGCFSDQSYKNYLQGAVIVEKTVTNNNKTYYYNLKKSNVTVSTFQDLKSALENSAVESVRLSNDISARTGSVISFEVNSPKVLFTNGFTIKNVKFEPVTTDQETSKAFFTIDGEGRDTAKLINEGVVIESSVDQIFLRYIDIESTGDVAIKINRGVFFGVNNQTTRTIEGTKAIEVNVGNTNNTVGDISINDYNLIGNAGPAIDVVKTNAYSYLNLDRCNVKSAYNDATAESEATSASSTIRINDRTRISAQNSTTIEGTKYGVYFTDTLPDTGSVNNYAGMQFGKKTEVTADIAFRLDNYTVVHFDDVYAYAKTSVMELHGFTQYVITSGEYSVSEGNDVISFVGVNPEDNYNWHRITGGYYSHELPDNEIFNAPNYKYVYDCVPVSLSNNPLPWVVARRYREQNNYQYIEVPEGRDVEIDGSKLDSAYDEKETDGYNSFDVVLTVKYKNDQSTKYKFDGHGNGFKEYYDIHVDKIVDNKATDNNDSTKNYQLITIPLNDLKDQNIKYAKIDNVKVYHKHGNSEPVVLKKINKDKATDAREECYYLEEINGNWYLNIITRRFSDFAIAEDVNYVETSELKTDYSLNLQYKDTYYLGDISVPEYAVYGDNKKISVQDVDAVYYSLDENDYYYGKDMPNKPGTYMAEWTVKEGKEITGSGKKKFIIKTVDLSCIKIKENLVYSGEPIKIIEDIDNIANYSFKLIDYNDNPNMIEGNVPTAVSAGTYQLWYSRNDVTEFIGNVIINKATIMLNKPAKLTATYGDVLSDITLPTGWSWVDNTLSVGDATTTGNKFKAIFTPSDTYNYNVVEIELPVVVNKAETDIKTITIPTFTGVEKGTLLSDLKFKESGWSWVNPKDVVSDSNYAVYNPDRNNYNDLLVSIPVYIKETVAGKEVSISNTVSSSDEKGIKEVTVANDAISNSVVDAVAKAEKSETKVSKEVADFINGSVSNSLTITTELVKKTVNDESKKQEAIEQANVKAGEVAMVLDLEIKIKVDNGSESKEGKVTELSEPVKLTFKLPEGSKVTASEGKELKYYVLIIHEGEVHKIPAVLNTDGTVTFETDKFSTYILISEEVDKPVVNNTPSYIPSQNKKPVVNTSAK